MVKILIGGMGRSGTSLLSKLFKDLNCNISEDSLEPEINAGIEVGVDSICNFLLSDKSGVAKSPFIYEIAHSKEFNKSNISLLIIPIRDPYLATFSRLTNELYTRFYKSEVNDLNMSFGPVPAGLHYTCDSSYQVDFLSSATLSLINQCLIKGIRFSLVPFPSIGDKEICEAWSASIEDLTSQLNISKENIVDWMIKNFKKEKVTITESDLENKDFNEIFTDYEIKKKSSSLNSAAFLHAHLRFKRKIRSFNEELKIKNEELKIKNDELNIKNEELKIKNVKLGIKNEELNIKNEELKIKNVKLEIKNEELNKGRDELKKILFSIQESRIWRYSYTFRKVMDKLRNSKN